MGVLLVFHNSKSSWKCASKVPHMHTDTWKSMLSNSCGWISNPAFQSLSVWWISKDLFPPPAGLNPNMNVNNMDITGGLSVKDTSQSQSRLPQWTHPNSMDNLSSAASSLDQNSSKHGNVPWHCPLHVPMPAWLLVIPATVQLELFLSCSFFVLSTHKWLVASEPVRFYRWFLQWRACSCHSLHAV